MSKQDWQGDFNRAWDSCDVLRRDTTEYAARCWYTKGRVAQECTLADDIVAQRDALLDRLERAEGLLEKYTREKPYECVDHYDAGKKLAREYSTFLAERPTT